ncbi:hypothetical protein D9756_004788 [Leucocoprinus leucothites]|uniref:Pentatricopeptide repeat-containing protein n=1 Tax=Leucocoprinus leucothites TaxID=201217 RepID=A0A8H5G949_9AGAR|nr:hypothetical protein D9756_004788 [Leucoagaricus leucothites]
MLLRRFLHTRIHFPRITISTSNSRPFRIHGPRPSDPSRVYRSDSVSTTTNGETTETAANKVPLFAHVGQVENELQPDPPLSSSRAVPRRSNPTPILDEETVRQKLKTGHPAAIERIAKSIIRSPPGTFEQSTWDLLIQDDALRMMSLPTLQDVLSFTETRDIQLSASVIGSILRRLVSPKQEMDIARLLFSIQPHLLFHLQNLRSANLHSVSYVPPGLIRSSFIYVHALLHVDNVDKERREKAVDQALSIFRSLVDSGHIPSDAMVDSSSSQTLEQIIDMSLVKASLYWNCHDVCETILSCVLQSSSALDSFTFQHATDCLYTLLTSPSRSGLDRCLNIIRLLHPHAPIPDSLIRQFYECAVDIDATSATEGLYDFTRSPQVLSHHRYPPPQGRALSKLMFHLAGKSNNVHLIRVLASDVVEGHLPVPLNDRAEFITIIAQKGIALPARALWELYATGKSGSLVYGDSGLMVKMVALFTNLAQRLESKVGNSEVDDLDNGKTKASDVRSFVRQIMSKFKEHHEPWKQADHRVITSYARACFIVGENTEGFDIFRVLLGRLELPDLYDVNVALSALAKDSPHAAARTIKKMEERGLRPDIVTFGTVLHHASTQKYQKVASEMMDQIMELETLQSNIKTYGALIRALVQPKPDDDKEILILKLQTAWRLIHQVGVPRQSTQIGNYLVSLSIKAEDATLAFKFWSALLKESADHDDDQQRWQRGAIISLARAQREREEMSGGYLQMICRELNRLDT